MKKYRVREGGAMAIVGLLKRLACSNFWSEELGQDLIEYALMAGLVAVAAGTVIPPMAPSISHIFSKAISVLQKFS